CESGGRSAQGQVDQSRAQKGCVMHLLLMPLWLGALQGQEAEDLFRKMEKQITASKTLQFSFDVTVKKDERIDFKFDGRLVLAEGNKLRLNVAGVFEGTADKRAMISNGKTMWSLHEEKRDEEKVPPKLEQTLKRGLCQTSLFIAFEMLRRDSDVVLADFKLGDKEVIGTQPVQIITYKITFKLKREEPVVLAKLWLHTKTGLPVRRELTFDGGKSSVVETYTEMMLDREVEAKVFEPG